MKQKIYYIIDFDSTFVQVEGLDELAKRALKNHPDADYIKREVQEITRQGMDGTLSFGDALAQRLYLFKPQQEHIEDLVLYLKKKITPSIKANKEFFKTNADAIYIVSGGFREYIWPVVKSFGIAEDHVLANEFQYGKKSIIGLNDKNPLSQANGKTKVVKKLKLSGKVIVLGDGFTDYQIRRHGGAEKFYAFTENVHRERVVHLADDVVESFDEFLKAVQTKRRSKKIGGEQLSLISVK